MGIGDALMSSGEARALHKANGLPVLIVDARGKPVWSDVFDGIPYIVKPRAFVGGRVNRLVNGSGIRPYIIDKSPTKWTWRQYKPKPAEIIFTAGERQFASAYKGMVMIEPHVKNVGHSNKAWPFDRWQRVVSATPGRFVQCGPGPYLNGVTTVKTPGFRHAAAVLAVCKAFVGTDGGLMHAAAAVGAKAVILWSEFTSPDICGYSTMVNLRHAGKACGNRLNCRNCRAAMDKITVEEVITALKGIL